jgi:hypothetical protein
MNVEENLREQLSEISNKIKGLIFEKKRIKAALDVVKGMNLGVTDSLRTSSKNRELTFKDKIKITLSEEFPNGASSRDILDYCNETWPDCIIKRSSISPQLSRLKSEEIIVLDDGIWRLASEKEEAPEGASVFD